MRRPRAARVPGRGRRRGRPQRGVTPPPVEDALKRLVFFEGRSRDGAVVVAAGEEGAAVLRAAGVAGRTVASYLSLDEADRIDEAAIAWTKSWGKRPLLDGRSFRDLLSWKGVSLWWFAELYLHHSTAAARHVRTIETFHRILEAERPDEVEAFGLPRLETLLLARTCTVLGVLFHGPRPRAGLGLAVLRASLTSRWNTVKTVATSIKRLLSGPPPKSRTGGRTVLFLSHAAFWRERRDPETGEPRAYEHYFDRLIPEIGRDAELRPFVLAVGPTSAFRRRGTGDRLREWLRLHPAPGPYVHVNRYTDLRVLREVWRATGEIRRAWRWLKRSPALRDAFCHRGVAFHDLAAPDLAGALLLQLPWAVRSYEEVASALDAVKPALACLYAESSGWGRAAIAACQAVGVPTVAIQHGILYPKYYSYRHGPDEAGCPRPSRTALFGEEAREFLVTLGQYPRESLALTGSPRFDELLEAAGRWDRKVLRDRLGVSPAEKLVVVASRYRGIRETHQSIGSAFRRLVAAVESLDGVRLVVKPHPAEAPDEYEADVRGTGTRKTRVLPPSVDLTELLHAADALITVESLSAVEALVLGRPVLVLNTPTNLQKLVEAGAALGVAVGADPGPALTKLLFDPAARDALEAARQRYLSHVALGVDGRATERILALIRETATARAALGAERGRV